MHPDRAHTTDVAIAEKILQIAQPWREPALGAENGLHTGFCRKVDQFSRGLRVRRQGPLAARTASSCCGPVVSTRTMSTSGWRTNSSIDPTTCLIPKVSAADCAASRRWL